MKPWSGLGGASFSSTPHGPKRPAHARVDASAARCGAARPALARPARLVLAAVVAVLVCAGCGGERPPANPNLERVHGGFFTLEKPRGWTLTTGGSCTTFAFVLRDPKETLRQILYFGTVGPVYLNAAQRQLDQSYVGSGGFAIPWIDAPVVEPLTPENLLAHWPELAAMKTAGAFMTNFPPLTGLRVVSSSPRAAMLAGATTAELRGVFTEAGRVGEGMFLASVKVFSPFTNTPAGGTGLGHFVCGISAPKGELDRLTTLFLESLDSFTVTQAYIESCFKQSQQQWGAVAAAGQTLREASDLLWDGWQARTHAEDITAEQYSDGLRGVERVYDPDTGTVYEVPAGWYEAYDANRGRYAMNGLQPLPASDHGLWTTAPHSGDDIH